MNSKPKVGAPKGNKNTFGKHWKVKDTSKMHHVAWNKGIPMSKVAKQKMIAKKIGKLTWASLNFKKGMQTNTGKTHFKKDSIPWNKGKECPQYSKEKHWNWQGGITTETRKRISTLEWKILRKKIYARDNWACQSCLKHCHKDIQCHHIIPWKISHNNSLNNLITLCKSCHLKIEQKISKR